ncbi:CRYBG3 [Branchiostoma lanceolatum]|uniref:CRYBG3 protein n=1 Tax=Branchiostoma lanceolatum TaxID=7740 RepID=A0A8J9ZC29_BRALA|nr:CRYBG3 [Branchiostoma lanceolatum]
MMMHIKGYVLIRSRHTGMLLDVSEAKKDAGTPLIVWSQKSEGVENQLWRYNSETGELESRLNGFRVDVKGGSASNSAAIISNPANGAPNQKWYFQPDGTIQSGLGSGWVLDVQGADTAPGTRVILYQRKEGANMINQQWDVVPYVPPTGFYIRSSLNDCYLQVADGSKAVSAPLCIAGKASGDRKFQRWTYNKETGAICSELNGYVVDVCEGVAKNSTKIIAHPAHGGANQKWSFEKSGAIVSGLGEKLVLDNKASGGAGTPVILYTLHGGKNQQWYISDE